MNINFQYLNTPDVNLLFAIFKCACELIPSKSTAFGRETRRASSDPACFPPRNDWSSATPKEDTNKTHGRTREPVGEAVAEPPGNRRSCSDIHAPNGGYLT